MAVDWIKMRTDLYRDPKVCIITDLLMDSEGELARYVNQNMQRDMTVTRNVMRNVTVGALVTVWGVLRHRGKRINDDLFVRCCTVSVIDDLADIPGFGEALLTVGWAVQTDEGVVLPRFFEDYNVDPLEEIRAKGRERQQKYRERQKEKSCTRCDVTVASERNAREKKRREEKSKKNTPLPPFESQQFADAWQKWLEYRTENHHPAYKPKGLQACWTRLAEFGESEAIKAIRFSMAQGWRGIFQDTGASGSNGRYQTKAERAADVVRNVNAMLEKGRDT